MTWQQEPCGRITFASLRSVAFGFVTHALARFKARYPAIAVKLIEDKNLIMIDRVLHREVNFGIGTLATPHKEFAFRELLQDELQVIYPAGHALAAKRKITWRDLAAESLVLLPRQSSVRNLVEHGFAVSGIACEPDYEVAKMVTVLSMTRARLGITVMPRIALGEPNMKGLRSSSINDPHPARNIGIITRVDRPLSPAAVAYVDLLLSICFSSQRVTPHIIQTTTARLRRLEKPQFLREYVTCQSRPRSSNPRYPCRNSTTPTA